jgi:hypothetical protein
VTLVKSVQQSRNDIVRFRAWLGDARISRKQAQLRAAHLGTGTLLLPFQLKRRAVAFQFQLVDEHPADFNDDGWRFLHRFTELATLASAVLEFRTDDQDKLPKEYRDDLLGASGEDYALEVLAAAHMKRLGYSIRWLPRTDACGEFAASRGGSRVHCECKRISQDWLEVLKSQTCVELTETVLAALECKSLAGRVRVDVGAEIAPYTQKLRTTVDKAAEQLSDGAGDFAAGGLSCSWELVPRGTSVADLYEFRQEVEAPRSNGYLFASLGDGGTDPTVIEFIGPLRPLAELEEKFRQRACDEAAAQLARRAGVAGVVCMGLPMLSGYPNNGWIQSQAEKLFGDSRDFIIAMLVLADRDETPAVKLATGEPAVVSRGPSVRFENRTTSFPVERDEWIRAHAGVAG